MHYRKQIIVLVLYYYQLLNDTKKYINKIAMRVQLTLTWSKPIYQKNQRLMNPTYEVHMFPFIFLIRLFYAPYSHCPTSPDPSLFHTIVLRFLVCTISQCARVPTNFIHFLPLRSFLFKHQIQYQKHLKYCIQVLFFYAKLSIRFQSSFRAQNFVLFSSFPFIHLLLLLLLFTLFNLGLFCN